MKNIIALVFIFTSIINFSAEEMKYPFLYIPGMFDNGDMFTEEYNVVKTLNSKESFYYKEYFSEKHDYNKSALVCSSNIIPKYKRLIVANLIGDYRKNIPLELMSEKLFCLIHGKAPRHKNFYQLTNYKGNDYFGFIEIDGKKIKYCGVIEELWAKYGREVFYKKNRDGYSVEIDTENKNCLSHYSNEIYYFNDPKEIKLNIIAHSSGGLAIRKYLELCRESNRAHHINIIINLSVPEKGAKINYELNDAFSRMIEYSVSSFYKNKDNDRIEINDGKNIYSYSELIDKTRIDLLKGDNLSAKALRKIISLYILYLVPFDGKNGVLGLDPALYDLHPDHNFIKSLNTNAIDKNIRIYNYKVLSPHAKLFELIARCTKLNKSDGIVDYDETGLELIPNYEELDITNIDVEKANHIPMPYIKPLFELKKTINIYYPFLKIVINTNLSADEGKNILLALISSLMHEIGFDLNNFLKNENYSVIDYFGDNPVKF